MGYLGHHVVHVDFTRISADELVKVVVAIELRGEAPGVKEGGVVEQLVHQIEVECPAGSIPDKLHVNINHLKLNEAIKLGVAGVAGEGQGLRRPGGDRRALHRAGGEAGGGGGRGRGAGRAGSDRRQARRRDGGKLSCLRLLAGCCP